MAKLNAHTASRDELREAGVRADLVDEILKRRRRKDGVTLEALDEVPGVGPATLEQLRQALDFTPPPDEGGKAESEPQPPRDERLAERERGGAPAAPEPAGQAADAAEAALRAGTEQAAELVSATVEGTGEAARQAVEAGTRAADLGARAGLRVLERTTEAAAEVAAGAPQGSAPPAPDAVAFGRTFLELLQEQGRENLAAVATLSRATDLGEVLKVQGKYLRGTLERMTELNRRWLVLAAGAGAAWPGIQASEGRGGGERGKRAAR